jgi:polyferredoxin
MNKEAINSPVNNQSVLSLVFGILTIVSFCTGMIPFPFTGFICFPASFLLGILALVFGAISLSRIRRQNESGSPMAWMGIILGGVIFLCVMCMVVALASLFIFSPDSIPLPPAIQNFSI